MSTRAQHISSPASVEAGRWICNEKESRHHGQQQQQPYHHTLDMGSLEHHKGQSPQRLGAHAKGQYQPAPAAKAQNEEQPASRGMVIFSVLFYLVAALVMVMANKWVLNSVPVPLFFLFVQLVMAVFLLHISAVFGYFTIPKLQLSACIGLIPLVSINVTGLIFNTYCLKYVDASFYQVARGLVLPFTVLFSWLLLSSKSSLGVLLAVAVVCFGFFLGVSSQHIHASTVGTLLGVFSSLTTSVHAIIVKKSLNVVKGSTMDLVYYNNLLSAALLSPLVLLSGESNTVLQMMAVGGAPFKTFLTGTLVTGVFGFLICIAGFMSIKVTSPVTHMISSAVRGVIQTFLGVWCFGDIITTGRGCGILFILAGSTLYTYTKDREQRVKEKAISHPCDVSSKAAHEHTSEKDYSDSLEKGQAALASSPVIETSSYRAFQSQRHRRNSTISLGINVALANNASPSTSNPSPRTPRSLLLSQQKLSPPDSDKRPPRLSPSQILEQTPSRRLSFHGSTASNVQHTTTPPQRPGAGYAIPAAYTGTPRTSMLYTPTKSAHRHKTKNFSLTDLQEVLITPYQPVRQKEEKAC